MKYNPDIHHRRSIRLKGYDYSSGGAYFVTVCVRDKLPLFGDVRHGEIKLNDAGRMIEKWWLELTNKFPSVETDELVVMPNHFHGILIIVGADLCARPNRIEPGQNGVAQDGPDRMRSNQGTHIGVPLAMVLQWFKTMTTNKYIRGVQQTNWPPFSGKLWQRNYYEHILRNEDELNRIRQYIRDNPLNWGTDEENPDRVSTTTPGSCFDRLFS